MFFFFLITLLCSQLSISFGLIYSLRAINTKNSCLVLTFVYVAVAKNNLSQCLRYVKGIFFNLPFKEILLLKIRKCHATLSCFSACYSHLSQKLFPCRFIITLVLMLRQVAIFDQELNSESWKIKLPSPDKDFSVLFLEDHSWWISETLKGVYSSWWQERQF